MRIFAWKELEEVDTDVPSLKLVHYDNCESHKFKMGATQNLETLAISYDSSMTNQKFHDLISKFPLLKCLHLESCCMLKEIKISSNWLQRFSLLLTIGEG